MEVEVTEFIKRHGYEKCLFIGITLPEEKMRRDREWVVKSWNSWRGSLESHYGEILRVVEKSQGGYWHIHCLVATQGDVRTGLDWDELRAIKSCRQRGRKCKSASPQLRAEWKWLREWRVKQRRKYPVGWVEAEPLRKEPECVAKYLSKYLTKSESGLHLRLVSYCGKFVRATSQKFSFLTMKTAAIRGVALAYSEANRGLHDCEVLWKKFKGHLLNAMMNAGRPIPFGREEFGDRLSTFEDWLIWNCFCEVEPDVKPWGGLSLYESFWSRCKTAGCHLYVVPRPPGRGDRYIERVENGPYG